MHIKWNYYEKRARDLFYTDDQTQLLIVVGNHDIGFHYDMTRQKIERFTRSFNNSMVQLHVPSKQSSVQFVLLNSMTLEDDGCTFCKQAQRELNQLNQTLECLKQKKSDQSMLLSKKCQDLLNKQHLNQNLIYSRPIIFMHYPLYRDSDAICPNDIDAELSVSKRSNQNRESYDCLSRKSTNQVFLIVF